MEIIDKTKMIMRAVNLRLFGGEQKSASIRARIGDHVILAGGNFIGANTYLRNTTVGYGSYISDDCDLTECIIGKYCSIAPDVKRVKGTHPTHNFASTYPGFFNPSHPYAVSYVQQKKFEEYKVIDNRGNCIKIGNDVWIGNGARILDGVIIGDGAIIAAGAVVVHNVEPYAIVGGVPAKLIRYRFEMEKIEKLLQLEWWNQPEEWIRQHADEFDDVDKMVGLNDI